MQASAPLVRTSTLLPPRSLYDLRLQGYIGPLNLNFRCLPTQQRQRGRRRSSHTEVLAAADDR
ncbi:hypothetical protein E4U30_003939, partial [Claviceps sp. LM220 group G6]